MMKSKPRTNRSHRIRIRVLHLERILVGVLLLTLSVGLPRVYSQGPDLESCYAALSGADDNADRQVDSEEYVRFLQLYRPGVLPPSTTSFADLPLSLQSNFYSLACACVDDENQAEDCCIGDKAHLPTSNGEDDRPPTATQQSRLFTVCFFSNSALNRVVLVTGDPTLQPTTPPTTTTTTTHGEIVTVSYTIVVAKDAPVDEYGSDLVAAMDDLAAQVAATLSFDDGTGGRHLVVATTTPRRIRQRKLQLLQVQLPTALQSFTDKGGFTMTPSMNDQGMYDGIGPCPADLGNPITDHCELALAWVEVASADPIRQQQVDVFQSSLNNLILEGELQESLQRKSPSSAAAIVSGQATSFFLSATDPPDQQPKSTPEFDQEDDTGIAGGATAGIVVSAFAVVGLVGFMFVSRRGLSENKDEGNGAAVPVTGSGNKYASDLQYLPMNSNASSSASVKSIPNSTKDAIMPTNSITPDAQEKDTFIEFRVEQVTVDSLPEDMSPDKTTVSEQSESGWSSDAYNSSVGSVDTEDAAENGSLGEDEEEGAMLKMVDLQEIEGRDIPYGSLNQPGETNLTDLASAIMVGDWAAVGTSAAALASVDSETSTDGSFVSASQTGGSTKTEEWKSRDTSWQRATDAGKAMELDELIEQGDWEAVIQAAAKFEAEQSQEGGKESTSSSVASEYYDPSETTESMLGDEDDSSSNRDDEPMEVISPGSMLKRTNNGSSTSIRSDVLELLRQVVPEEVDNVDEMLSQFQGREEDLIEILRHQAQGDPPK